ncbi:MAG: FtsL-like putative cell division protein [Bacteroidales bacterium]
MKEDQENINQSSSMADPASKPDLPPVSPVEGSENKDQKRDWSLGRIFQSIMAGTFLTRENVIRSIPFLFFLAFLGLVYIANTYYAEKTVRAIDQTKRQLKELRYEHITAKSELMYLSKQSEVTKRMEGSGLKPTIVPPFKIEKENLKKNDTK